MLGKTMSLQSKVNKCSDITLMMKGYTFDKVISNVYPLILKIHKTMASQHQINYWQWLNTMDFHKIPVKNLPKLLAASTTALYPEMLAMELRASKTWALLIRGIMSMAKTFRFFSASCLTSSGFCLGYRKLIKVDPALKLASSSVNGARTLSTMSDWKASLLEMILAPALAYSSFWNLASKPAFSSMLMLNPFLVSVVTVAGDIATLRSFLKISLGTPMVSLLYGVPFTSC